MYLQFYINDNGDKVYTTKKESPLGLATQSAHPARFSPDEIFKPKIPSEEALWIVTNPAVTSKILNPIRVQLLFS